MLSLSFTLYAHLVKVTYATFLLRPRTCCSPTIDRHLCQSYMSSLPFPLYATLLKFLYRFRPPCFCHYGRPSALPVLYVVFAFSSLCRPWQRPYASCLGRPAAAMRLTGRSAAHLLPLSHLWYLSQQNGKKRYTSSKIPWNICTIVSNQNCMTSYPVSA
jgi:hypothetical protein